MSGTFEQKMSISSKEKRQLLAQLLKRKALSEFKYSPLSFAQQQLWFLNQLEPENPFYNIPFALHLKGPLQVEVLERSLREIVRRHEALRTTFGTIDGLPQQVIAPSGPPSQPLLPGTSSHLSRYGRQRKDSARWHRRGGGACSSLARMPLADTDPETAPHRLHRADRRPDRGCGRQ